MDPVSLFVGSLTSFAVTELIKLAVTWTKAAVKCKPDCKKLQDELLVIAPDVERIERRLVKLLNASRKHGDPQLEDLATVGDWLRQLKSAIEGAKDDVHRCNSGRLSLDQHKLSARLRAHFDTITRLGHQRQTLFLLLRNLMDAPAQADVQQQHHLHQQDNWYNSPGEAALLKMTYERNEALRREELTRLSMSSTSSSSGHGGSDYASGYGTDSPRANLLRQGTQASNVTVFHQDEQKNTHLGRRHTMAGGTVAQMAKAHGHDAFPPHGSWKY